MQQLKGLSLKKENPDWTRGIQEFTKTYTKTLFVSHILVNSRINYNTKLIKGICYDKKSKKNNISTPFF